jgi:N-acylneuraminate cytidylyltransferase
MWTIMNGLLKPILKIGINKQPSYNSQYKTLPKIYVQNASLEISRVDVLKKYKTITHKNIIPFFIKGFNAFDINYSFDIKLADFLVKNKILKIPKI